MILTRHAGHAAEAAAEGRDYAGVAVVGGDGTLFEVLKGMDRERQRIALFPAGRGNALGRDLGLMGPRGVEEVLHWRPQPRIDLLEVRATFADGRQSASLAASTVALGYAVMIARRAQGLRWMGAMSYAAAAAFMRPHRSSMWVEYGGESGRELWLSGLIANNTHHIANFHGYPEAHCADGVFEVMEMDGGMPRQTAHNLSALSGTGIYQPYPLRQTTAARVHLKTPQDLMLDGEIFPCAVDVEIRLLPAALACNRPRAH